MMQLGFVSAILPDQPLEEVFALAAELGYDCVELMCWPPGTADRRYAGVTHIDVAELDDRKIEQISLWSRQYGVAISGLGYYPNVLSPRADESQAAVEHIHRVIDACARLGVPRMTSFVGRDPSRSVDANWGRMIDLWGPIVEFAEQRKICIAIENCPMLFTGDEWPGGKNLAVSPAIWRRMFTEIPSRAWGLNYDPSHMVWQQMDYVAPLREFADRLVHVHAKDVRLDRHRLDDVGILATPLEYHTPKLPGMGEVNWGKLFSVLTDVGYDGPVCVEVEDRAYEGSLASRRLALQQSCTYLRNFVPREPVRV